MQSFETTNPVHVVLDIPAGRIQVVAAERTETTVEVRPVNPSSGRDVKAAEQTTVAYEDGVLRVAAGPVKHRVLGHSGAVEVTIELPAGSRIEAKTAAGEFHGAGPLGLVAVECAYGVVKLDEAAGATVQVQSGDVHVRRLTGPAEISTQKGDILVTEAVEGALELSTQAGSVTVGAAQGVSATLDASTGYGRIRNGLTNAEGAAAALNIRATTSYGDITARSL